MQTGYLKQILTFSWSPDEETVMKLLRRKYSTFFEDGIEYHPFLEKVAKREENKWYAKIIDPFLD